MARDLVEAGELPEDEDWALAGAGARRGAAFVLTADAYPNAPGPIAACPAMLALGVMRDLRDGQDTAAKALGLDRSRWHRVPVTLADVEHALC